MRRVLLRVAPVKLPDATMRLIFAPGEAAQVDFGAGPALIDPVTGEIRKTWFFVMTLCWSRHQYAEIVWNQTTMTWLACHRHAFNWFGGVPGRIIIDNAKCAIIKACINDPTVQRAYAEYAEGYLFRIKESFGSTAPPVRHPSPSPSRWRNHSYSACRRPLPRSPSGSNPRYTGMPTSNMPIASTLSPSD
ncbi:hypothetical protein AFERRI_560033 [Acidithiobacillus ferrivorans]|uniref:Uncharacterized protein n=1 Tax=Acidithiobacillus ferrivorans TaxID=160808 RepID=A0A060UYG2_9PROT|nr:hypothetical protein AFERRI_560033 [Acidithiobacillus ferrivorans]